MLTPFISPPETVFSPDNLTPEEYREWIESLKPATAPRLDPLTVGYLLTDEEDAATLESLSMFNRQVEVTNGIILDDVSEAWDHRAHDDDVVWEITVRRLPMLRKRACKDCGSTNLEYSSATQVSGCLACAYGSSETNNVWVPEGAEVKGGN
jgi:hypothetical protein